MQRWTGSKDSGTREYTSDERARVVAEMLKHVSSYYATTIEMLGKTARVEGRALRQIISDIDGVDLVVGYDDHDRIFVCEHSYQAEHHTLKLLSQARAMQERAERRRDFFGPQIEQSALL
jgi:hypothetical protein